MRGLATAIGFLTVLPVGSPPGPKEADLGRSVAWFPLVGGILGLMLAGLDWCGRKGWDPCVAAALMLGAGVVVTGGLHVDGLMDTADAFFSRQPPKRMLEIMRDARSGALGVAAGVCVLAAKLAAYAHLEGTDHWRVVTAAPVAGRLAIVIAVVAFPYAREAGIGSAFATETGIGRAVAATVMAAGILSALLGWAGLAVLAMAVGAAAAGGAYVRRRLGGLTGDVYGAVNEVVEVGALLLGALCLRRMM